VREFPETWWMSARSWTRSADSQTQDQALAGLHADYILFVLNESGGIPDAVMASKQHSLPASRAISYRRATRRISKVRCGAPASASALWHLTEITADPDDPRRTPRVMAEWAREQIQKYAATIPGCG
jgi:phage terminase large subunit